MLLNPYRFASAGGGSGHRYWRWINIAVDGGYLEISELRVVNGSTPLSVAAATAATAPAGGSSGNGVVAELMDDSTSTRTYWTAAAAEDSGFWIRVDLGSPQVVTGMQMAGFDNSGRYPTDITLQWSDDDSSWTTFGTWSGLTYPGDNAWGPVLTP